MLRSPALALAFWASVVGLAPFHADAQAPASPPAPEAQTTEPEHPVKEPEVQPPPGNARANDAATPGEPGGGEDDAVDLTGTGVMGGAGQESAPRPEPAGSVPPPAEPSAAVVPAASLGAEAEARTGDDPSAGPVGPRNHLSFSLLGFIGRFRLTYERMLSDRHGVFGEVLASPNLLGGFDFPAFGGSLGYRFHWRGPGRGPFVGFVFAFEGARGTIDVPDFRNPDETHFYEGDLQRVTLAPHAGYRWVFRRGFSLCLRGGLGVSHSWADPGPDAERRAIDLLAGWGLGVDGEASVGWAF